MRRRQTRPATTSDRMPVGTGPYKFKQWDSGSQVVLERFDDYHDACTQIREANYVVLTNPETALTALQTGESDVSVHPSRANRRQQELRTARIWCWI
ncbi:MAG: ABC transporter substrate-binding protein [Enterocloster bolteae]